MIYDLMDQHKGGYQERGTGVGEIINLRLFWDSTQEPGISKATQLSTNKF